MLLRKITFFLGEKLVFQVFWQRLVGFEQKLQKIPAGADNQSIDIWFGMENEDKISEFSMRN